MDNNANLYITGNTTSSSGIATKGAYQTSYGGGAIEGDAFLAKFDSSGTIQWATYFGGRNDDYGRAVATDGVGNVYITGSTESPIEIATSGSFQTIFDSTVYENGFLVKFNSSGVRLWSTYYAGIIPSAVTVDNDYNPYITGETYGNDTGIVSAGAYQTIAGGLNDVFLAKFNSSGIRQWATYYGGSNNDVCLSVATDNIGNVYLTGYTSSTSDIATQGAYLTSFRGGTNYGDAFIAEFTPKGNIVWATYYGGTGDDIPYGISLDESENIYIVGQTLSESGISTAGSYQPHFTGTATGISGFLAKFGKVFYDAGISTIQNPSTNACADFQTVKVEFHNYGSNEIDSVRVFLSINDKIQPVFHWTGKLLSDSSTSINLGKYLFRPGLDTIKAWTYMPNGFKDSIPENDTSLTIINVFSLPSAYPGPNKTICEYTTDTIGVTPENGNLYSWVSIPAGFQSGLPRVIVSPLITTAYYLTVTSINTGCGNSDSIVITVNPAPPAVAGKDQAICLGDSTVIGDTASEAYLYKWTSRPSGFSSTIPNPTVHPLSTTMYDLVVTNPKTGCMNSVALGILVNPLPTPNPSPSSYNICIGTHIKIGANAKANYIYAWSSMPAGFSSSLADPVVDPLNNTVYSLSVTDTTTGCMNNNSTNVFVGIAHAPVIDVGKNQAVCAGFSAQIGSDSLPDDSYSWISNPIGFVSSKAKLMVKPIETTSYLLTVTSSIGCTNFDSVTVTVNPLPSPKAGSPQNICAGTAVQLGMAPINGHIYSWTSNPVGFSSTISNPIDTPKTTTKYYLKETNSTTGCADSDSVIIYVVPLPIVSLLSKVINGYTYQFAAQNPNYRAWNYRWDFGDSVNRQTDTASGYSVSHTYPQNGKYIISLTVSVPGFCTVIYTDTIVINLNFSLNIYPNAFSLQTDINYTLANPAHIRISVVDEIGRQIGVLKDAQLEPGEYNTEFSSTLWKTRPGMYFVLFEIDGTLYVRKIIQVQSIYY